MIPVIYRWDGDVMVPLAPYRRECDARFVVGQKYVLGVVENRSDASHKHEFAWLREAWQQLPEGLMEQFPTPEHLRKRALIDAGFFDQMAIDAGTRAAAIRVAAGFRAVDPFIAAVIEGPIVLVRTAKSQSRRAMGRQQFQESKQAVLEIVSGLIGTQPERLVREAGRAA